MPRVENACAKKKLRASYYVVRDGTLSTHIFLAHTFLPSPCSGIGQYQIFEGEFCLDVDEHQLSCCTSLSKLLENNESNPEELTLWGDETNRIGNALVILLVDSLAKNTKLRRLWVHVKANTWSHILKLVCDTSSINHLMKSNHTLVRVCFRDIPVVRIIRALGVMEGNLLRASININEDHDKMLVGRHKILWSHARGDINIGDLPIIVQLQALCHIF